MKTMMPCGHTHWRTGTAGRSAAFGPSVLLLERGQVFNVAEKRIFAMGGASSHDVQDGILEPDDPQFLQKLQRLNARGAAFRIDHRSWWKEELPSRRNTRKREGIWNA